MIKKSFLLAFLIACVCTNTFARDHLPTTKVRDKGVYIELLGSSNLIGVSFDSRFTSTSPWGYRLGISYFLTGKSYIHDYTSQQGLLFPIEANYLLGKKKHKLELGGGICFGIYEEETSIKDSDKMSLDPSLQTLFGYYLYSNIGYRYQALRGFMFRIGASPSFSFHDKYSIKKSPFIYPYLSFGYAF